MNDAEVLPDLQSPACLCKSGGVGETCSLDIDGVITSLIAVGVKSVMIAATFSASQCRRSHALVLQSNQPSAT